MNIGTTLIGTVKYVKNKASYSFGELGALGKQIVMNSNHEYAVQLVEVVVLGDDLGKLKIF